MAQLKSTGITGSLEVTQGITGSITGSDAKFTSITGSLEGSATNATNIAITDDTASNAVRYLTFVDGTSGNNVLKVDSSTLVYNPNSNTLLVANLQGNASTATTLYNTRQINGTNFNGSANITTAQWGTSRNITIGNTTRSINGSTNYSWSLSDIGAAGLASNNTFTATNVFNNDIQVNSLIVGKGNSSLSSNTAFGINALSETVSAAEPPWAGNNNTAIGYDSQAATTIGYRNTSIGSDALSSNTVGAFNTAIGWRAGYSLFNGSSNLFLGSYAGGSESTLNSTAIISVGNGVERLRIDSSGNVSIGTTNALGYKLYVNGAIGSPGGITAAFLFGDGSGITNINASNIGTGTVPTANLPSTVVYSNTVQTITETKTFSKDIAVNGLTVGKGPGSFNGNTAFGEDSLSNVAEVISGDLGFTNRGERNTAVGFQTLKSIQIAKDNVAIGYKALNITSGSSNVAIGSEVLSLLSNASNQTGNTAVGYRAGQNLSSGSYNVFIGPYAGSGETSLNNTIIFSAGNGNERMRIDSNGNVAIGTTPSANVKFLVSGDIQSTTYVFAPSMEADSLFVNGNISTDGIYSGNGSGITNINAANIGTGTVSTSRLPSSIVYSNTTQTITGIKTFSSTITGSITGSDAKFTSITGSLSGTATRVSQFLTFSNTGNGDVNGTLYNGQTAKTISYNTIGAPGINANNIFTGVNTFSSSYFNSANPNKTKIFYNIPVGNYALTALDLHAYSPNESMVDGFGTGINFKIGDSASPSNDIASIYAVRDGADNRGTIVFTTADGSGNMLSNMYIKSNGNVGVGTYSPMTKFGVGSGGISIDRVGSGWNDLGLSFLSGSNYEGAIANTANDMRIIGFNRPVKIYTNNTTVFSGITIDDSDNFVGIGDQNPSAPLTVASLAGVKQCAIFNVNNGEGDIIIRGSDGSSVFHVDTAEKTVGINRLPAAGGVYELAVEGTISASNYVGISESLANDYVGLLGTQTILGSKTFSATTYFNGNYVSSARALHSAGTEELPSISFTNDPDTGFYIPSGNWLRLVTGASTRITIDNNGYVGIGETIPTNFLSIAASFANSTAPLVLVQAKGTGQDSALQFKTTVGNFSIGVDSDDFVISSGTSLATNRKFEIDNLNFAKITTTALFVPSGSSSSSLGLRIGTGSAPGFYSSGGNKLYVSTNNTNRMIFDFNGFVGVNTTSPDATLHIKQLANSYASGSLIFEQATSGFRWQVVVGTDKNLAFNHAESSSGSYGGSKAWLAYNATVSQLDFTGQHRASPSSDSVESFQDKTGLIVVSDGVYSNFDSHNSIAINEAIPLVSLSTRRNQKSAFGVISDTEDPESSTREYVLGAFGSGFDKKDGDDRLIINSIGEGAIWVCNINGNLENGDYITTCEIPGYGMKQDDDLLHNYTVAKITCDCDFNLESPIYICEEFQWEGQTYRRAFVGCTYHCG
jgi:hypothetical protein